MRINSGIPSGKINDPTLRRVRSTTSLKKDKLMEQQHQLFPVRMFIVSEICFVREGHRKGMGSGKKTGGYVLFVGLLIGWLLVGWLVVAVVVVVVYVLLFFLDK